MGVHLYQHQLEGGAWLARTKRGILAWEPGTGKTFAALAAAVKPVLVIAPAYLLYNWEDAIKEMYPNWKVGICVGTPEYKKRMLNGEFDVVVCSYNLLASCYPQMMNKHWPTVICDEAHNLRGRNSKRTKAAYKLRCEYIYLLTGTPVVNNAGDYYPLLRLCNSRIHSSYWKFISDHCYTKQTPWSTEIGKVRDPARFQDAIAPYVSYIALSDVFADIPDATWTKVPVLLSPTERIDHDRAKKTYNLRGVPLSGAGALIPALRNLTAASKNKLEATRMLLADHEERVVIWVWYRESAQLVADHCIAADRPLYVVTGEHPITTRVELCEKFLMSQGGVLIATIASLGEGQNLQGSRTAVFYEMSYLATQNTQAIARQRRHGQKDVVRAYGIVATKSVDEAVYRTALRRDINNSEAQGINAVLAELMRL